MDSLTKKDFFDHDITPIRILDLPIVYNNITKIIDSGKGYMKCDKPLFAIVGSGEEALDMAKHDQTLDLMSTVGDLDIVFEYDSSRVKYLTDYLAFYTQLRFYYNPGLQIIHILVPDQDSFGLDFDTKFHQVDLILTDNIEFAKFARMSRGYWKGVYRNLALFSLAKYYYSNDSEYRLWFHMGKGLLKGRRDSTEQLTVISRNPKEISKTLSGGTVDLIESFEQTIPLLERNRDAALDFSTACKKHKLNVPRLGCVEPERFTK